MYVRRQRPEWLSELIDALLQPPAFIPQNGQHASKSSAAKSQDIGRFRPYTRGFRSMRQNGDPSPVDDEGDRTYYDEEQSWKRDAPGKTARTSGTRNSPARRYLEQQAVRTDRRSQNANHNSSQRRTSLSTSRPTRSSAETNDGIAASNRKQSGARAIQPNNGGKKNRKQAQSDEARFSTDDLASRSGTTGYRYLRDAAFSRSDAVRHRRAVMQLAHIPESILGAYEWDVSDLVRHSNVVRVVTDSQSFALKRTHISAKKVMYLHELLEYAKDKGFRAFAPFAVTRRGKPYIARDEEIFYATEWVTGNSANFHHTGQVAASAQMLARFHEATRGFSPENYRAKDEYNLADMTSRRLDDLHQLWLDASNKRGLDDFDTAFIDGGQKLIEDARTSLALLRKGDCQDFLYRDSQNPGVCHLDVIPGNILQTTSGEMCLIDFDLAAKAPRTLDLAHLLRRALQRSNWSSEIAYQCFLKYNEVREMEVPEYLIVQSLLTFPYRVWRLAHTRYRVMSDNRQTVELQEALEDEARRHNFLTAFEEQIARL